MVVGVGDDDSVVVADGDVVRVFQLSGLVSRSPELRYERPVALEDLNSVVLLVADVDESQSISADAPGIVELPVSRSLTAECSEEVTAGVKDGISRLSSKYLVRAVLGIAVLCLCLDLRTVRS